MTKRDFFIVMIKLFGLLSIVTSLFSAVPTNISFALMDFDLFSMLWVFAAVAVLGGLFVLLIFNSGKVVSLLRLDHGFDDDRMDFGHLNKTDIVKIGTFVIGGLLLIDNMPGFLSHTFFAFKGSLVGQEYSEQDNFYWVVSGCNLILGYLMVTNLDFVARLLRVTQKENEGSNDG